MNIIEAMKSIKSEIEGCSCVALDVFHDHETGCDYNSLWAHYEKKAFRASIFNDDMNPAIADLVAQIDEYKKQLDKEPEYEKRCG